MTKYLEAAEVEELAKELISEFHSGLLEARIRYLFREGPWVSKGQVVRGQAKKASAELSHLANCDFIVTINYDKWTELTEKEKRALVDHELMHCARLDDDKDGNPRWGVQDHDVEDFALIIKRHGLWKPSLRKFHRAVVEHEQMSLFHQDQQAGAPSDVNNLRPTGTE